MIGGCVGGEGVGVEDNGVVVGDEEVSVGDKGVVDVGDRIGVGGEGVDVEGVGGGEGVWDKAGDTIITWLEK